MSILRKIKYQSFRLNVPAANAKVSTQSDAATVSNYEKVTGVQVSVSNAIAADTGTFDKFEIDSQEIYPPGFGVNVLSCGRDVPPNDRFDKDVEVRASNSPVNITYTDPNTPGIVYPYVVVITLKLSNPTEFK